MTGRSREVRIFIFAGVLMLPFSAVFGQTTNQIAKFNSSGGTVNSAISEVNGNVAIGATGGLVPLHVVTGASSAIYFAQFSSAVKVQGANAPLTAANDIVFQPDGRYVGIGGLPLTMLDVSGTTRVTGQTLPASGSGLELDFVPSGNTGTIRAYNRSSSAYQLLSLNDAVTVTGGSSGKMGIGISNPQYRLDVSGTIHASGDITSSGSITANYQDVAEWVPSTQDLAPGTVVVLDRSRHNQVIASANAYDTTVAGVVSEHPGIVLGSGGAGKAQVATTGRVHVKVDATSAPLGVGDLLVTSDVAGTAMRSVPVIVGGVSIHRPGTIIGKALEPLQSGTGEILVLLSLQ